jgi:hypothetical protein
METESRLVTAEELSIRTSWWWWETVITANGDKVSFGGNQNVVKFIIMTVLHFYAYTKIIKLCSLNW